MTGTVLQRLRIANAGVAINKDTDRGSKTFVGIRKLKMSEDRYVGTISKHEMVVDRYDYEYGDQRARAWDALCSRLKKEKDSALLTKMDELLKEEKDKDREEEDE